MVRAAFHVCSMFSDVQLVLLLLFYKTNFIHNISAPENLMIQGSTIIYNSLSGIGNIVCCNTAHSMNYMLLHMVQLYNMSYMYTLHKSKKIKLILG